MDVTSAINSLGNDYVAKVTDAMKQSAAVNNTNGSAANQTFRCCEFGSGYLFGIF